MKQWVDENGFVRFKSDSRVVSEEVIRHSTWLIDGYGGFHFDSDMGQYKTLCFPSFAKVGDMLEVIDDYFWDN